MATACNNFSDRNWRNLLMDIEARQVIPIIGSELLVLGAELGHPTLYQHLAKELVSRLSLDDSRLAEGYGVLEVTSLFFQDPRIGPMTFITKRVGSLPNAPGRRLSPLSN